MKFGIVIFPGSNCDRDCHHVVSDVMRQEAVMVWHKETKLPKVDCVILPGGFSYGDYLRPGAIARFSPIMSQISSFAKGGGRVLGICNGFQVLVESGLLPGSLLLNEGLTFICDNVSLELVQTGTPFTRKYRPGENLVMPVAHHEGRYYADQETLNRLDGEGRVVFRYLNNPNGSSDAIAGICNEKGNVLGMMPHPERCAEGILGGIHGKRLFESLLS
jgi:phosphoribosylformylglycinamidine synthase subunit PurQ / glutaminase